ncbi:AdoMet dependent proline di-methyltransferase-domain-containing protein [Naematelia encephala]|uniref:Alpha N-terminal protein methyltransferase 1 n=1 Tax=Naematelia encephala TaxID=71784 RepID=A0A1Y2AMT0_9TREE|nr:AdoMet dependent proline di-methyltransferase-domain-containing protein [Naematelia encephala]
MPPSQAINGEPSSKRQRPNVGSALKKPPAPSYDQGLAYWDGIEASVDGVLGGFGNGPVPHVDQLSSRLLLLSLIPSLGTFPNPLTPSPPPTPSHRLTALDVGAGIGRVSRHVLLPLFEDVITVEPVGKFIDEGYRQGRDREWADLQRQKESGRGKRVWFVKGGLQTLDPRYPAKNGEVVGVVGEARGGDTVAFGEAEAEVVYDAIWCQWCLGHMSTPDLITFFKKAQSALRDNTESFVFVKENCCDDAPGGTGQEFLDEEDSSLTRSHQKWLDIFKEAGLEVVREEVQEGLPDELFVVKTWALR